jgi:putative membrane protein
MVIPAALTEEEHASLSREIRDAEAATSGQIYVVVAHSPDMFRLVPILWAALFALILAWALDLGTELSTSMILSLQALGFIAAAVLLSAPVLRYRIVPAVIAEDAAHRAALAQFMAHGVHLTSARTGVLIYVSLLPRRIEILADSGIHTRVGQAIWDEAVARLAAEIRTGPLGEALAHAIRDLGALLAVHFPRPLGDRNELPNRVIEV